ncbi:MAG: cyclic pyranopterin monophosphate synthase MoaC [Verrucomicrobiota bacterium]
MKKLSHLDDHGNAHMVDVSAKPEQIREAIASGSIHCKASTLRLLKKQALPKGDVLTVAQIAGIQAAKQTSSLIPLCHPLPLHQVDLQFKVRATSIEITSRVKTTGKTGVEMEALTAVSVAALTLYDMLKAVDKTMSIEGIRVLEKTKKPVKS